MKVLLDTHIVLFSATGELSKSRIALLEDPRNKLFLSAITLWEITKLYEAKQLDFEEGLEGFLQKLYHHPRYTILGLIPEVLIEIPPLSKKMHKDPADQIIVASAICLEAHLMTNDRAIVESKLVPTL